MFLFLTEQFLNQIYFILVKYFKIDIFNNENIS